MKSFLKILLSIFISFILLIVTLILIAAGIITANKPDTEKYKGQKIVVINLQNEPLEHIPNSQLEDFFDFPIAMSHYDYMKALLSIAKDDRIEGVLINGKTNISQTTALTYLSLLDSIKQSGKFIESYGEYYNQNGYLLSSIADRIVLNPNGSVRNKGYGFVNFYLKDFFKKFDIEPNLYVAGKYKSFGEMYVRNESSPENTEQFLSIVEDLHFELDSSIAKNRNLSFEEAKSIRENYKGFFVEDCLSSGLIDTILFKRQYEEMLCSSVDQEFEDAFISIQDYYSSISKNNQYQIQGDRIAMLVAEGEITNIPGANMINEDTYRKAIKDIREDKNIKAVILRINSPGGSASVSDEIWNELSLLKLDSIPIIVSMGNLAGSGGYYIACPADEIYAQPSTITGSIGVIGIEFDVEDALQANFDINVDYHQTSPYSLMGNPYVNNTKEEIALKERSVDETYLQFKSRVANGRNMSLDEVEQVAQGRIYSGIDAKKLGLVDKIGDLNEVINATSANIGIDKRNIVVYPKHKLDWKESLNQLMNSNLDLLSKNNKIYQTILEMEMLQNKETEYTRMPDFRIF